MMSSTILWYLYILAYAYLQTTHPVSGLVLQSTLLLAVYLTMRVLFSVKRLPGDVLAGGIVLWALVEAAIGIYQMFTGTSNHHRYAMTGSFFNPGPYGTMLAMGLVMAVALWRKYEAMVKREVVKQYVVPGVLLLLACMLLFTWSRAAILAAGLSLLYMYRQQVKPYRWWAAGSVVVLAVAYYLVKQGSADGRGIIWWVAGHSMWRHPWIGTGIGSFKHQYALTMTELTKDMPVGSLQHADVLDYAFNEWLHIGVEQGLVGLLLAGALLAALLRQARHEGSTLKWCLPPMLITSLFSYTFELLQFQIIMVVVMAHLANSQPEEKKVSIGRCVCYILTAIALCWLAVPQMRQRARVKTEYNRIAGYMDAHFIPDYYEMLPCMLDNPKFLFAFGKALRQQGRWNDSNDMLRRGELASTDPMFVVMQGNNYADMDQPKLAEACYERAYRMLPNRIYPLYRLMKLYETQGKHEQAAAMARCIVTHPIKIKSPATQEMKQEAQTLYEKSL